MTQKIQFGSEPEDGEERQLRKAAGERVEEDVRLEQALTEFRASVHAWSDGVYGSPQSPRMTYRQRNWRLAAGWALGCVLVAGGVSGVVIQHERRQQAAQVAAAQQFAIQQRQASERERAQQEDRNLMAKVDNSTSQEVPSAMEPLAQLMEEGQTQ